MRLDQARKHCRKIVMFKAAARRVLCFPDVERERPFAVEQLKSRSGTESNAAAEGCAVGDDVKAGVLVNSTCLF